MKRNVQILLFFACLVPVFAGAREETMEERKRRIMRKYLRERMDITYSETVVPDAEAEDEEVLASEKFQQPQVDLKRQRPGAAMPLPVPRPPPPQAENRNWLLSEDPEVDDPYADPFALEDPYADPFALKDSKDERGKPFSGWTDVDARQQDAAPQAGKRFESRYDQRGQAYSPGRQVGTDEPSWQGPAANPYTFPAGGMQQPGYQQQGRQMPGTTGWRGRPRETTFGQGQAQSPFMYGPEPSTGRSYGSEPQRQPYPGHAPYRSPSSRPQQRGSYVAPQQEYRRPDANQQWKRKDTNRYDPTRKDAFVEETMPKVGR